MDRSRSKRGYYYDHDSDSPPPSRSTKPRYSTSTSTSSASRRPSSSHRAPDTPADGAPPPSTTFYRILCPEDKSPAVIGKSAAVLKALRQETGAWIGVHPLAPGDEERLIETSDSRRREPDGRPPQYSPAQEALLAVHERILDAEEEEDGGYDAGWGADRDRGRITTRLVVPRMHVGCLMGKGGKIIEQMRIETKTHIRILPRDQNVPRCVSQSEEIVQVVGEANAVKKAVAIISSRLKESLHRDRGNFHGRLQFPDHFSTADDEFVPYTNSGHHRSDGADLGPRASGGLSRARNNPYYSRPSGYAYDTDANLLADQAQSTSSEDLVFRILCPNDKVENIVGESDGILEMLREDVGVDVIVTDPIPGSNEQIIVISSEEGPDDELFPAQEALLHIQSRIVDLHPDKDNIITTRLLVPSSEIGCLEGRDGSLSEITRVTNTNIRIVPREEFPSCIVDADELVQIVGEIRASREALVQITARLKNNLFRDICASKNMLLLPTSASKRLGNTQERDSNSPDKDLSREASQGQETSSAVQTSATARQSKDGGGSENGSAEQEGSSANEETQQNGLSSTSAPFVTKKVLEITVPEHAVRSLTMRSGSKLILISEMSGASVNFIEDRPDLTQKVIQISGSPEQAERAQSLLQGFILSTQDDAPSA